ncbi:MAG: hypothetical protein KGD57_03380 [Candidatus Lokiarchaeota archaeon]|nr:hypothetical protein [Candidatus Lokiarchaeota archaeon]
MSEENKSEEEYKFENWTIKQLRDFASINNISIPSKSKKNDIIELLKNIVSNPEFVDRTKEEHFEEELIVDFKEDEVAPLFRKEEKDLKFWQKPPFSTLLNLELAKDSDVAFYDLSNLVNKFFDKMIHEDFINYKVSGIALKTSASLHHHKITSIIKEEEEIQKKEEIEQFRQRTRRGIPKTLTQPIQSKLKITSKDELFEAMRAAIIETMQKKEKLRRQRLRKEEQLKRRKELSVRAQLPRELLKHISGKEQTIEELLNSWYNKIKAIIKLEKKEKTNFFELIKIINEDQESNLGRKYELVRMFLALMFLSTNSRISLEQNQDFTDIKINLK